MNEREKNKLRAAARHLDQVADHAEEAVEKLEAKLGKFRELTKGVADALEEAKAEAAAARKAAVEAAAAADGLAPVRGPSASAQAEVASISAEAN
jgi:hypothetical protein